MALYYLNQVSALKQLTTSLTTLSYIQVVMALEKPYC